MNGFLGRKDYILHLVPLQDLYVLHEYSSVSFCGDISEINYANSKVWNFYSPALYEHFHRKTYED